MSSVGSGPHGEGAAAEPQQTYSMDPRPSFLAHNPEERFRLQSEEIRHLRGKIKGYQTLGALFQEKTREVASLKKQVEELKVDSLSMSIPGLAVTSLHENPDRKEEDGQQGTERQDNEPGSMRSEPAGSKQVISLNDTVPGETEEILRQAPPSPPLTRTSDVSSLSYKIINTDGNTTPRNSLGSERGAAAPSLVNFHQGPFGASSKAVPEPERYNSDAENRVPSLRDEGRIDSNAELSLNTREELSRLVLAGDIDGGIIKYVLKSAKLGKQCRTKQVMLDTLMLENQQLKINCEESEKEITTLRQEILKKKKVPTATLR